MPAHSRPTLPSRPPLSRRKKLFFSAITTVAFLGLVELLLYGIGVRKIAQDRDPFVGFSQQLPLFESVTDADGAVRLETAKNKLHWFNYQTFPRKKVEGTRRVFCMGGSTTYGHPYDDNTSFSGWLREFLPVMDATHRWEVINCGGISYASYRVAALMEELIQYEPDLFIVYSAHNEFLERRTYANFFDLPPALLKAQSALSHTRIYSVANRLLRGDVATANLLPGEVDEVLNHTIGPVDYHRDPIWRQQVLAHYELNLRRMVAIARGAGCEIVFVTPAANESHCSPFKSEFDAQRSDDQQKQVLAMLEQSSNEELNGNQQSAIDALNAAKSIAPEFAEVRYRLGKLLYQDGQNQAAHEEFRLALNEDVCPLRAVDEIGDAIHRVGNEVRVQVVEFESKLRELNQREYDRVSFGEAFFLDHVHPTIDVNRNLALWIIEALKETAWWRASIGSGVQGEAIPVQLEEAAERVMSRIDQRSHGIALRNLAKVLHWSGKFAEAIPRAVDALELLIDDPESRYVLADSLYHVGDVDSAVAQYELLFSGEGDWGKAYLPYGDLLVERGDFLRAKSILTLAVLHDPGNAYVHYLLGRTHLELGEFEFAAESLKEADRIYPNEPQTLRLLQQAEQASAREPSVQSAVQE